MILTSSSDHTMSQERKEGVYSAPKCPPLVFRLSGRQWRVAFSKMAVRRSPHPAQVGGSVLSSIYISVALRPQQRWSRLTAPRGPREGTHFCVVLLGQSFWEPGHRDVGKPRGPQ